MLVAWERRGEIARQGSGRGTYYVAAGGPEPEQNAADELPARHQLALRLVAERGRITRQEYEKEAGVSPRTAKRDLADLVRSGWLRCDRNGRNTGYIRAASPPAVPLAASAATSSGRAAAGRGPRSGTAGPR